MKFLKFIFNEFDYDFYYKKKYMVNKKTKEIHKLETLTPNCTRYMSKENKLFLSRYDLEKFMEKYTEANGCNKCYKEFDTDKKYRG